jgi:hypothetical protein
MSTSTHLEMHPTLGRLIEEFFVERKGQAVREVQRDHVHVGVLAQVRKHLGVPRPRNHQIELAEERVGRLQRLGVGDVVDGHRQAGQLPQTRGRRRRRGCR